MKAHYTCPRCGYATDRLSSYQAHLERKKPCRPLLSSVPLSDLLTAVKTKKEERSQCPHCHQLLSNPQHKYRHGLQCQGALQARLHQMREQRLTQGSAAMGVPVMVNNITTNNVNITNAANVQINIYNTPRNKFGDEKIEYMCGDKEQFISFVFDTVLAKKDQGLIEYVRLKYFHPQHPENHTVKIVRVSEGNQPGLAEMWNGTVWVAKQTAEIIDGMISDVGFDLHESVSAGIEGVDDKLSRHRRKILNAVMLEFASHIELEFSEVPPEGLFKWDKGRGVFVSGQRYQEMRTEGEVYKDRFYRDLERSMEKFQINCQYGDTPGVPLLPTL